MSADAFRINGTEALAAVAMPAVYVFDLYPVAPTSLPTLSILDPLGAELDLGDYVSVAANTDPPSWPYVFAYVQTELFGNRWGPYKFVWTFDYGEFTGLVITGIVEVVGTQLTNVGEVRATHPALGDLDRFNTFTLNGIATEFEDLAERYIGWGYTRRGAVVNDTAFYWTDGRPVLRVDRKPIRDVYRLGWITEDGDVVEVSTPDLPDLTPTRAATGLEVGRVWDGTPIRQAYAWIAYGDDTAPVGLVRAAREYVRAVALRDQSGVPRDVLSMSFGDGTSTRYATPDWAARRPTGYMEVDRLLNALPRHYVPGIA